MAKSVKVNFIYNMLNTATQMLYPLVTFPYASRILLADGIGQVDFFNSIIQYIVLFSSLGIPLYAIRESARVRNDERELSKVSLEIAILHTLLTVIGYLIVFVLCFTVDKVMADLPLFLLLSLTIIFNAVGCNWLFQGVEDFKYITIRGLIVRVICIVLLFVLVHSREDLIWYALLTIMGTVGANIFNLWRMRLYVKPSWHKWKDLNIKRHIKPCLKIFSLNLIISIYCNLDLVMLGFLKDESAVGYYTAAHKIQKILLTIVTSLGAVMLPRLSNLIAEGKNEEFARLSQKSVDFIVFLSVPMFLGLIVVSEPLIHLFCGDSYEPAITTLKFLSPVILIIGLSNLIGIQVLYPQGKENLVIISTAVGAVVNFGINWFIIPVYGSDGAAFATLIAELCVTVTQIIIGAKYLPFKFINKQNVLVVLSAMIMFVGCYYLLGFFVSDWLKFVIVSLVGSLIYLMLALIFKFSFVIESLHVIKKSIFDHGNK